MNREDRVREAFYAATFTSFEITPLPLDLSLLGLLQSADDPPEEVSLAIDPPDLPFTVVYAGRDGLTNFDESR